MDRDDKLTALASWLGGIGAFTLIMGALISASGSWAGRAVTLVGLVMLIFSLAIMLSLFAPKG